MLANDDDPDTSDDLLITVTTQGTNGLVIITGSGTGLTYTPDANYFGTDTFTYTIDDGNGATDTASVDVTITSVNDAPIITTTNTVTANQAVLYSVDYNATDVESDTLAWSLTTNASWLSIGAADGILSGTPTSAGTYSVNIVVNDGNGGLDWRNFTLTVMGITVTDTDGDGVPDADDDFPADANETTDTDGDGTGDNGDAFPDDASETVDTDGDDVGNNADDDDDGDGWLDTIEEEAGTHPLDSTDEPVDEDGNGIPDNLEGPADTGGSNTWLYIILILVIVGIIGAIAYLKMSAGKGGGPSFEEEPPADRDEASTEVEESTADGPSLESEGLTE